MELFKFLLFGITGLSVIFVVCVIALWHTYMFPRFFAEDRVERFASEPKSNSEVNVLRSQSSFLEKGELRPLIQGTSLGNRFKYSRKSLVLADFNPVEESHSNNRLYTSTLLSLGIMSFLIISYGLHSGLNTYINSN